MAKCPRPGGVIKLCNTPEGLLRSPGFAQFLSFFNKARHLNEVLGVVTPPQVAESPELAEKVYRFYRESGKTVSVDGVRQRGMGELAKKTVGFVRRRASKSLDVKSKNLAEMPEWLKAVSPADQRPLPAEAVEQLERKYQEWFQFCVGIYPKAALQKAVVSTIMNNFKVNVVRKPTGLMGILRGADEKIIGPDDPGYGERMRDKTWGEFFEEIDRLVREKGVDPKVLQEKDCMAIDMALLPVFLELLRRGYKVYPDLTI